MLTMDPRVSELEGTGKDKENAQGNLHTSYHSESFVETEKVNMKSKIIQMGVVLNSFMEYLKSELFRRIYKMKKDHAGTTQEG